MKLADAREKRIALRETPIFRVPIGDRDELHRIAESLLEGNPRTKDLGGNGDTKTVGAAIAELVKTV